MLNIYAYGLFKSFQKNPNGGHQVYTVSYISTYSPKSSNRGSKINALNCSNIQKYSNRSALNQKTQIIRKSQNRGLWNQYESIYTAFCPSIYMFQTNSPDSKAVFINFFSDLRSSAAARCTSSDSCPESELGDAHFSKANRWTNGGLFDPCCAMFQ